MNAKKSSINHFFIFIFSLTIASSSYANRSSDIFTDPQTGVTVNYGTPSGKNGACYAHLNTISSRNPQTFNEKYVANFNDSQKSWIGSQVRLQKKITAATSGGTIKPFDAFKKGLISKTELEWSVGFLILMNGLSNASISNLSLSYLSSCEDAGLIKL